MFSADGSKLASTDQEGVSKLWDLDDSDHSYVVADLAEDIYNGQVGLELERAVPSRQAGWSG